MTSALNYNYSSPNNSKAFETKTIKALEVAYDSPPFAQTIFIDKNTATGYKATPSAGTIVYSEAYDRFEDMFTLTKEFGSSSFTYLFEWNSSGVIRCVVTRDSGSGTTKFLNQNGDPAFGQKNIGWNNISGNRQWEPVIDSGGDPDGTVDFPVTDLEDQTVQIFITDGGTDSPPTDVPAIFPPARPSNDAVTQNFSVARIPQSKKLDFFFPDTNFSLVSSNNLSIYLTPTTPVLQGWRKGGTFTSKSAFVYFLSRKNSATAGSVDLTFYVGGTGSDQVVLYDYVNGIERETYFGDGEKTITVPETSKIQWYHNDNSGSFRTLMLEADASRDNEMESFNLTPEDDGAGGIKCIGQTVEAGTYDVRFLYDYDNGAFDDWYSVNGTTVVIEPDSPCPSTYPQDRRNRELQGLF